MKQVISILVLFLCTFFANGQTLSERALSSEIIVEGKIINKQCFWNQKHTQIFTKNIIEVSRYLKGSGKNQIELITQGGEVDDAFQELSHGITFEINQEGIFLCRSFAPDALNNVSNMMLNGSTGFLEVQKTDKQTLIYDFDKVYKSLKNEVYPQLGFVEKEEANKFSGDLAEIEFDFFNLSVTDNSNIEFDVYARCPNQVVRFAGGDIVIKYSKEVFNEFAVKNNNVNITKGEIVHNNEYQLKVEDYDNQTIKATFDIDENAIGKMYLLGPDYANLFHVKLKVSNFGVIANLSMNSFAMKGNVYYHNRLTGKMPFNKVTIAKSIPQLLIPTITSHDTIATAGTGFILNIKGTDFGTAKGEFFFKNANTEGISVMSPYFEDILQWTNTLITVRVPSNGTAFPNTKEVPAGSGKFEVRLPSSSGGASLISPKYLEIKYAVLNYFTGVKNIRIYQGENLVTDGNIDGILTFRLSQNVNNNADAKKSVKDAMCDWSTKTGISWNLGSVSAKITSADNDSTNLIYLAPNNEFFGESLNATAFTKLSGTRLQICSSPVRFMREFDIVIRENVVGTPVNAAGGYNFNNTIPTGVTQIDFYSVVAHELGHCHLLKHALNDTKIMYPVLKVGQSRKIISLYDKEGGIDVLDSSIVKLNPFPSCVKAISKGTKCLITSISDKIEIDNGITIYPNPFNDVITIKSERISNKTIELYNNLGQLVSRYTFEIGNNFKTINTANLQAGIYFVTIHDETKFTSFKLIRE
jgi:hypothetical protein